MRMMEGQATLGQLLLPVLSLEAKCFKLSKVVFPFRYPLTNLLS